MSCDSRDEMMSCDSRDGVMSCDVRYCVMSFDVGISGDAGWCDVKCDVMRRGCDLMWYDMIE